MHSPPRPLTVKDQQDWKIPPCVSNWKNAKAGAGGCWLVLAGASAHRRRRWRLQQAAGAGTVLVLAASGGPTGQHPCTTPPSLTPHAASISIPPHPPPAGLHHPAGQAPGGGRARPAGGGHQRPVCQVHRGTARCGGGGAAGWVGSCWGRRTRLRHSTAAPASRCARAPHCPPNLTPSPPVRPLPARPAPPPPRRRCTSRSRRRAARWRRAPRCSASCWRARRRPRSGSCASWRSRRAWTGWAARPAPPRPRQVRAGGGVRPGSGERLGAVEGRGSVRGLQLGVVGAPRCQ